MRRILIAIFALLALTSLSAASYYNGYVNSDGYTYNDGYWYNGDVPYTRTQYATAGYWYYGVYYPGTYYWSYTRVVLRNYPAPTDRDWRSRLLDIAAERDKQEARIRRGAYEQQYFLDSVRALGLHGNFRWEGYGTVPPYLTTPQLVQTMPYAGGYPTNFGANASTAYGYSYNSIAQLYGDTNLNQLFQQASQLTQNAQKLAGDGNTNFQALVGEEGRNRARVAEVMARGQVAHMLLQALQGPSTVETRGFAFRVTSAGKIERSSDGVTDDAKDKLATKWQVHAAERCGSCHDKETKKGGFDVATYPEMSMKDKQEKVWARLTTSDDTKVMPRPKDGEPVKRLTNDELRLWFLN